MTMKIVRLRLLLLAVPATIAAQAQITSVTVGGSHTCALRADGTAFCWNGNKYGQLGDGSTTASGITPVPVAGGIAFRVISAGDLHTCGVATDGILYCWGANYLGQLGHGTADSLPHPKPEPVAGGLRFQSVSAGEHHTCGITSGGAAYCWGDGQAVTGAPREVCGKTTAGSDVYCSTKPWLVDAKLRFSSVTAGGLHSCGLMTGGAVYCWGSNEDAALGVRMAAPAADRPVRATVRIKARFAAVSAGATHSCAVTTTGEAYCWGMNRYGQLGLGKARAAMPTPAPVTGGLTFKTISAGRSGTCGITAQGGIYCWGSNQRGEFGTATADAMVSTPTPTGGAVAYKAVSVGGWAICGLAATGELYCWGARVTQPYQVALPAPATR